MSVWENVKNKTTFCTANPTGPKTGLCYCMKLFIQVRSLKYSKHTSLEFVTARINVRCKDCFVCRSTFLTAQTNCSAQAGQSGEKMPSQMDPFVPKLIRPQGNVNLNTSRGHYTGAFWLILGDTWPLELFFHAVFSLKRPL